MRLFLVNKTFRKIDGALRKCQLLTFVTHQESGSHFPFARAL